MVTVLWLAVVYFRRMYVCNMVAVLVLSSIYCPCFHRFTSECEYVCNMAARVGVANSILPPYVSNR